MRGSSGLLSCYSWTVKCNPQLKPHLRSPLTPAFKQAASQRYQSSLSMSHKRADKFEDEVWGLHWCHTMTPRCNRIPTDVFCGCHRPCNELCFATTQVGGRNESSNEYFCSPLIYRVMNCYTLTQPLAQVIWIAGNIWDDVSSRTFILAKKCCRKIYIEQFELYICAMNTRQVIAICRNLPSSLESNSKPLKVICTYCHFHW